MLDEIVENTRFLLVEVENQVHMTFRLLTAFDQDLFEEINDKDDYIDNLKTVIENKCFSKIHVTDEGGEGINAVRALHVNCVNLERIADFCVNIARQVTYLKDRDFINRYEYKPMFEEIEAALAMIVSVFLKRDLAGALAICRAEFILDRIYKINFERVMKEFRKGEEDIENLITVIFMFRYLERIGDALLNIGEALIFAITGDRIKIRQIEALEKTLSDSDIRGAFQDIHTQSIWGSRSGCRISRVEPGKNQKDKPQGIFKEGVRRKIKTEWENILKWETLLPGLAPRVFAFHETRNKASLLIEYLPGCNLQEILLTGDDKALDEALAVLEDTLGAIWNKTLVHETHRSGHMEQLRKRLPAVRRIHPDFFRSCRGIDSLKIDSTEELIEICARVEEDFPAAFTVFIHGDFNVNNIVYSFKPQKVNFIDLHRSKQADFIQDVSVFLVSNFRLPVFENPLRDRLNRVIDRFWRFSTAFAARNHDRTFHVRMALALARSFYTSTRFELNREFAREMFLRSHFLLEQIAAGRGAGFEQFKVPTDILFY